MKISLSNLVRLQEAVASPFEAPPEPDQTGDDEKKRKDEELKTNFDKTVLNVADKTGGYVDPRVAQSQMSSEELGANLDRWSEKAKLTGTNIATIRAEEINAAVKADKERAQKQEEEKRQQNDITRFETNVRNVSAVEKSFTGQDVSPTKYLTPNRVPDWSRTMNEFGEATDKLLRKGYGKKDPNTGHMVLGLNPTNPQHAQTMKETVFEVREEKADKRIKEIEDYNKLVTTLKTLNPSGSYDNLKEFDPKQFYQELGTGRQDDNKKEITYRTLKTDTDKKILDSFSASQTAARQEMAKIKEAEKAAKAAAAPSPSAAPAPAKSPTNTQPGQAPANKPTGQPASKPTGQPATKPATQPAGTSSGTSTTTQPQSGAFGGGGTTTNTGGGFSTQASANYSTGTPGVVSTPELLAANLGAFSFGTPGANAKQLASLMYKSQTTNSSGDKKETKETGISSTSTEYASAYSEKDSKKNKEAAPTSRGALRPVGVKGNKGYESQLIRLSESVRFQSGEMCSLNEKRAMTPAQASVLPGGGMLADIDMNGIDLPKGIMDTLKGAYKSVADFGSKATKTAASIAMVPPKMRFATRVQDVGLTPKSARSTAQYFASAPGMVAALANLAGDKQFAASVAGASLLKAAGAGRLGKYGSKLGPVGKLFGGSEVVSGRIGRDIASMIDIRIPGMVDPDDIGSTGKK